jgi:hypothetical protein
MKHVYEFTNKRKLTKKEFIHWFEKKFLYTIRKFQMIQKNDIIGYSKKPDFRSAVLEELLKMFTKKYPTTLKKLPGNSNKIALPETLDTTSLKIVKGVIKKDLSKLKEMPTEGKIIKPLYLFLDKEVLLYAKLKGIKFKKTKTQKLEIIENLEEKHPEIKHSIINGYLELVS